VPNIKSAKKKVRQDKKRKKLNEKYRRSMQSVVKSLNTAKSKSKEAIKKAFSTIDKATKKKIIHKNKAARLKARISKLATRKK
jgi:small subunit ribosomal protein S20